MDGIDGGAAGDGDVDALVAAAEHAVHPLVGAELGGHPACAGQGPDEALGAHAAAGRGVLLHPLLVGSLGRVCDLLLFFHHLLLCLGVGVQLADGGVLRLDVGAELVGFILQGGLGALQLRHGLLQLLLFGFQLGFLLVHLLQHLGVLFAHLLQGGREGEQVVEALGTGDHGHRTGVVHDLHGLHAVLEIAPALVDLGLLFGDDLLLVGDLQLFLVDLLDGLADLVQNDALLVFQALLLGLGLVLAAFDLLVLFFFLGQFLLGLFPVALVIRGDGCKQSGSQQRRRQHPAGGAAQHGFDSLHGGPSLCCQMVRLSDICGWSWRCRCCR